MGSGYFDEWRVTTSHNEPRQLSLGKQTYAMRLSLRFSCLPASYYWEVIARQFGWPKTTHNMFSTLLHDFFPVEHLESHLHLHLLFGIVYMASYRISMLFAYLFDNSFHVWFFASEWLVGQIKPQCIEGSHAQWQWMPKSMLIGWMKGWKDEYEQGCLLVVLWWW